MKYLNSKKLIQGMMVLAVFACASTASAADFPAAGNFANGAKAWADNCSRCHNMRGPTELRDDQWITTTFHMRLRGGLTGQETRDIITFLQTANNQ